jgi:hypothetical protein
MTAEWPGGIDRLLAAKVTPEVEAAVAPYLRIAAPLAKFPLARYPPDRSSLAASGLDALMRIACARLFEAQGQSRRRFESQLFRRI